MKIEPKANRVLIEVPEEFYPVINRKNNLAERLLMSAVLDGLFKLRETFSYPEITELEIGAIVDNMVPTGAKMLITVEMGDNLALFNKFIPKTRYIQKSDTAIVLEEIVHWLQYDSDIPKKIESEDEKMTLFIDCVNALIDQLRLNIKEYDSLQLVKFLSQLHEAVICSAAHTRTHLISKIECYSKYKDVISEFRDDEFNTVNASLAIRNLIEFVAAEPYYGNKKPNLDDVDYLIAIMNQINTFGFLQDSIRFKIDNPEVGLLDSGRIGVSKDFHDNQLYQYGLSHIEDDIVDYEEHFYSLFEKKSKNNGDKSDYYDKVDEIFQDEWGITMPEILAISQSLCEYCFTQEKSVLILEKQGLFDIIKKSYGSEIKDNTIEAFIEQMAQSPRGKMDTPPEGYGYPDIFPWRYNRSLSFINNPIIIIPSKEGVNQYLYSSRFLMRATNNLIANFHNGSLKIEKDNKGIRKLLAERNNIKGKEFRSRVYNWFSQNTDYFVSDHEVKIGPGKFLEHEVDLGDIDLLVVDQDRRIMYAIECKNTKQAKTMYDFQQDINNYLKKQIPKHENRIEWLKNNYEQIIEKFELKTGKYKIETVVISSHQLPIKFLIESNIPFLSINEIRKKGFKI